jgi:hypothetical protein
MEIDTEIATTQITIDQLKNTLKNILENNV